VERNAGGFVAEPASTNISENLIVEHPGISTDHHQGQVTIEATARKDEAREPTPQNSEGPAAKARPIVPIAVENASHIKLRTEPSVPQSSPSDAGSLPMEDPEDSDADPDWLVDAT
jgi:xeroderma pigmentosum group C-complementing protein